MHEVTFTCSYFIFRKQQNEATKESKSETTTGNTHLSLIKKVHFKFVNLFFVIVNSNTVVLEEKGKTVPDKYIWEADESYYELEMSLLDEEEKEVIQVKEVEQKELGKKKPKSEVYKDHGNQNHMLPTMHFFSDNSETEESDIEANDIEYFDYDNLHLAWSPGSSPKSNY